jgi:glycosyltransferase involved in cell wall biosynthesis
MRAVRLRASRYPGALHHFEGDTTANVIPFIPSIKAIWSSHDISTMILTATHQIERELRLPSASKAAHRREARFYRAMERRLARSSNLTLCISTFDHKVMATDWGCTNAEYLPTSIADDNYPPERSRWSPRGLRLLSLGRIAHLTSYRSLEFLFSEVFPRLDAATLDELRLNVVGDCEPGSERARRIMHLAEPFGDKVTFHGHFEDPRCHYSMNDLQLVVATDATGLRTRAVESFAYGLPVLCTSTAARGLDGLQPDRNIIVHDHPAQLADAIRLLAREPSRLAEIARNARANYKERYSRQVVASTLRKLLNKYFPGIITKAA